ncbi:MAG: Hsp20/alpha crystallin family protein, partial [Deltaproteobacteria bacterium]|nr:Hsp20/alpha crystallin family protein [Deltaproteobacteria bacterium]
MASLTREGIKDLTSLQDKMSRLFSESVKRIKELAEPEEEKPWNPAVDVYELPGFFVLAADLPGVPRQAVSLEIQGSNLIIKGERPAQEDAAIWQPYRAERRFGIFERTFNLPGNVAPDKIQARLADGVLTV